MRPTVRKRSYWLPWLVMLAGLVTTLLVTRHLHEVNRAQDEQQFRRLGDQFVNEIVARLETQIALLRGVAGLLSSNPRTTLPEFRNFVARLGLENNYPGVAGIGYIQRLSAAELPGFEARMREWYPDFHVWPQSPRDEYYSIAYMEPLDRRNRIAIGYDMFTETARRTTMERAAENARPAATGRVRLVQDQATDRQDGFLIYVPLYGSRTIPPTVEARRDALTGFAYAPFRMSEMMSSIFGPGLRAGMQVEVFDGPIPRPQTLLYHSLPRTPVGSDAPPAAFELTRQLNVAGQLWTLVFSSTPIYERLTPPHQWLGDAMLGLLLTFFVSLALAQQMQARSVAEQNEASLRASEAGVREANERYRITLASIGSAVFATDDAGRMTLMNPEAERLAGRTTAEARGLPIDDVLTLRQQVGGERITAPVDEVLGVARTVEFPPHLVAVRPDGTRLPVEATALPIRSGSGTSGMVIVLQDLSERLKAAEALRESEQRFRSMAEVMPQMVWTAGPEGAMDYVNQRWYQFTGRNRDLTDVLDWRAIIHPDDLEATGVAWDQALRIGGMFQMEHRLRRGDGVYRWHLSRGMAIRDSQGRLLKWVGTATDIHEQKETQAALQQMTQTLEQRVAERTAVAEQRAAQLRLLAAELNMTEQRERRRLAQILHDHLQQLVVAAKLRLSTLNSRVGVELQRYVTQADGLLNQVIQVARSLTVELSPPILYDRGLAPALEWLARQMEQEHELTVEVEFDPDGDPPSENVRVFLFQAIRELLFNIVKHAGVHAARVKLERAEGMTRVCIMDHGAGFDMQAMMDNPRPTQFGLFNIQQRIEVMGGSMTIVSAPGQGCTILLEVPLSSRAPAVPIRLVDKLLNQTPIPPSAPEQYNGHIRILVADDHRIFREGLIALLREQADFRVVGEASDGRQAFELALKLHPDVIIMDLSMPHMNGIEATELIRHEIPGQRVIGLSMHEKEDMTQAMQQAGAERFLSKDGPSRILIAAIRGESADASI